VGSGEESASTDLEKSGPFMLQLGSSVCIGFRENSDFLSLLIVIGIIRVPAM